MPFTFSELKTLVYRNTGYGQNGTTVPSDVITRVADNLNEAVRRIIRDPEFGHELRHIELPLISVANQKYYSIPQVFSTIDFIRQTTNDRMLRLLTLAQLRRIDPGDRSVGPPERYVEMGRTVFMQQPAATGTGIWAVSTAIADVNVVKFQGVRVNGDIDPERSVNLTGTTRVPISALTDYTAGISFTITTAATGAVSLYDAAVAGTELARIPIGRTSVFGSLIRLWPTPTDVLTYLIDGELSYLPMSNATDIPLLPEDYQDIPYLYAKWREYQRDGALGNARTAEQDWLERVNDLRVRIQFPPDFQPVAGQRTTAGRISTLGAWFPANNNWP